MSTSRRPPLIGLSGRRWPAESIPLFDYTALHGEEVDVHLSEYPKVLEKAGALCAAEIDRLVRLQAEGVAIV